MKKLLQILISLFIPFVASAQMVVGDMEFYPNWNEEGTCYLSKYNGISTIVTIPESIIYEGRNYTVTKLVNSFSSNEHIEEVILPSSIKEIGSSSFIFCKKLKKINLPEGLLTIGLSAFNSTAIENVCLPSTLQEIGDYAFCECSSLNSIILNDNLKKIGEFAFILCEKLTSIVIPKSIEKIQRFTFDSCISLNFVSLNEGLTEIGEGAFEYTNIKSICFPKSLRTIKDRSFNGSSLTAIHIPNTIEELGINCFDSPNLQSVTIDYGESVLKIGENCFGENHYRSRLPFLYIDRNIHIQDGDLGILSKFTSILLGEHVTDISWLGPSSNYNLHQITSNNRNPPTIGKFSTEQYNNVKVFIPKGAKANYENDANWAFFQNLVELEYPLDEYEISAEPTEVTMNTGDQFTFTIKVTPEIDSYIDKAIAYNDPVIYSSPATDSPTIFTGNSTTIWSSQPGENDLTFRLLLNNKTTTCHVTVIQPATSIMLNKKDLALQKGESSTLFANVSPTDVTDSSVTWSSTNPAVATVDNGLVTAVGGGECEIVATTHNGLEARCHVSVPVSPESISFEAAEVTVLLGDKVALTPILSPEDVTEKSLVWATSDANVATVEDGVVTCVGLGEATITATTVNNLTAECKVIVNPILAETITLDHTEVEVPIGETFTLTATICPDNTTDKTITWSSSNPDVAAVEDGVVSCIGVGEATITATTSNGLTATCTVKVQPIMVESIEIDPASVVAEEGDKIQLTAIVLPENATDKNIEWTSDNPSIAEVDENGLLTIISQNVTTIHAKATDGSGVEGTCEVTGIAGVESLLIDGKQWNVFTPDGVLIRSNVTIEDIRQLAPAIYIISDGTRTLKLVR